MNIYTTLQKGEYHLNNCEDYLFSDTINRDQIICAVMDGCTMGIDSYFISTLVGKLLRKIIKAKSYTDFYAPSTITSLDFHLKDILHQLFHELKVAKNLLQLERNELLTTLIILFADIKQDKGVLLVVGDGVISVNGTITVFDQENKPDYLGYHLSEDFDEWYSQQQKIKIPCLSDISIATDGITSFTNFTGQTTTTDPIHYLLTDQYKTATDEMLNMKLKQLEHTYGVKPTDDLAIIRLIKAQH
jgi:hypothetical protein